MATTSTSTQASSSELAKRRLRKRQTTPVLNGIGPVSENKISDFLCPICFEIISEPYMTKCGHTFCYSCICKSLEQSNRCPKCNFVVDKKDQVFPNIILNDLITKQKQKLAEKKPKIDATKLNSLSDLQEFLTQEADDLNILDVNHMLEVLTKKKQQLEADSYESKIRLLRDFLTKVRLHKQEELQRLNTEISLIETDSKVVEELIKKHPKIQPDESLHLSNHLNSEPSTSKKINSQFNSTSDGFNSSKLCTRPGSYLTVLANRRKRMHAHFDDLQQTYFNFRMRSGQFASAEDAQQRLNDFTESLSKFTRFTSVRPLATLNYANDQFNGSNIVSSIEFDKDNEFFAIAGVTKKIKMFEYASVICDTVDIHYPINEMLCNSKISCISWSSYHKSMLASSDYEGTVTLWDAFTGQKAKIYQEHEKRCWSVDFNKVDTKLVASGSDDSKVKLWSTDMEHSVTSLEAKANVCCVKFNPDSRYHLTFGSADHCVHYYDLRNTKQALEIFKGHKKAVSYVKFLNKDSVVSASTDSQLKLWSVNHPQCLRSFKGHLNEKNFVGLATDGDFIACGSENNSLYTYYKGLSSHVLTFRFDTVRSVLENTKKDEDANEFVSAVCWKMGSNVVVAANSQGTIKILELI